MSQTPEPQAKILVVEDDRDVRNYAATVLNEAGFTVLTASDGAKALDLIQREPGIDLLFTDVVMPGLDGFDVARRAVAASPRLKVLFTSGYATDLSKAPRLLKKPYRATQLVAEVTNVLGKS